MNKRKLFAIGKVALGVGQIGGAIATATGHGVLQLAAATVGIRIPPGAVQLIVREQVKQGEKNLREGMSDLDNCV